MTLDDAYALMTTDPRTLLDSAYLSLTGGDASTYSKLSIFTLSKPAALQDMYTNAGGAKVPTFQIEVKPNSAVLPQRFTSGDTEYRTFSAFYVAMKQMASTPGHVPAGTYCTLPSIGGSDLCVTSQLSGCTFGIGNQLPGGCCVVSHIQPVGTLAAAQPVMAQQTADLHGAAPRALVEKGVGGYADRANVLGKRTMGHWDFFIQKYAGGFVRVIQPVEDL